MSQQQNATLADPPNASPARRSGRIACRACAAVMICAAVASIIPAAGLAENRASRDGNPAAANTPTCSRQDHLYAASQLVAGSHFQTSTLPFDGTDAADMPVWKTITLGTHDSVESLRQALKSARCGIGRLAGAALDRPGFTVSRTRTVVDLVLLSAAELGVSAESVSPATIYERAARRGLRLCPAEVAPQLRLQYPDQPPGEFVRIAMEPIAADDGRTVAFTLGNGGAGLLLIGGKARSDLMVSSRARFVFVRPRQADSVTVRGSDIGPSAP